MMAQPMGVGNGQGEICVGKSMASWPGGSARRMGVGPMGVGKGRANGRGQWAWGQWAWGVGGRQHAHSVAARTFCCSAHILLPWGIGSVDVLLMTWGIGRVDDMLMTWDIGRAHMLTRALTRGALTWERATGGPEHDMGRPHGERHGERVWREGVHLEREHDMGRPHGERPTGGMERGPLEG